MGPGIGDKGLSFNRNDLENIIPEGLTEALSSRLDSVFGPQSQFTEIGKGVLAKNEKAEGVKIAFENNGKGPGSVANTLT